MPLLDNTMNMALRAKAWVSQLREYAGCERRVQLLVGCSTWEIGPHAFTGQHTGADSRGMGAGELALRAREQKS